MWGDQPRIVFAPPDRPGGVLLRLRDQSLLASFLCEINRPAGRHQKGSPVVSGAHCDSHGGQLLRHERLVLKCHADRNRPAIKYDDAVLYLLHRFAVQKGGLESCFGRIYVHAWAWAMGAWGGCMHARRDRESKTAQWAIVLSVCRRLGDHLTVTNQSADN